MPNVTVAISTYNRGPLVVAAVESVLAQSYTDYEVVVVDNGSTDDTPERLRTYEDRIRYVRQENRGRAGGRNRAIELANGRYIAFLDSDDLWLPDKLERQLPVIVANARIGLVHGHVELIDDEGRPLPDETRRVRAFFEAAHREPATYARYVLDCRCLTSTILVRRECFDRVGVYDSSLEVEDLDLYLRILREFEIVFLHGSPLARYRVHASQTTNEELARGRARVLERHLATAPEDPHVRRNLLLALGDANTVLRDGRGARRYTLQAVRRDPSLLADLAVLRRLAVSFVPAGVRRRL